MAKQHFLLLACITLTFILLAGAQDFITDQTYTIKPCTTQTLKWNINPTAQRFYITLDLTSQSDAPGSSLTMYLTQLNPNVGTNLQNVTRCPYHMCSLNTTNTATCRIEEGCGITKGLWYVYIVSSAVVPIDFTVSNEIHNIDKQPVNLVPSRNETYPADPLGRTTREVTNMSDPIDRFDFYSFDVTPTAADVEGIRMVIEVNVFDLDPIPDPLPVLMYLNYKDLALPTYECFSAYGVDTLEIDPCSYKQGGKWYLTVDRTVANLSMEVKVYKEEPRIIDLATGQKKFDKLLKNDDVVYFRFSGLKNQDVSKTVFFSILDNVDGGELEMQVSYDNLPFGACLEEPKDCVTYTGCHTRHAPCELTGKTTAFWYLGVKVRSIDDVTKPITFTVSADVSPLKIHDNFPLNTAFHDVARHGQYSHYIIPESSFQNGQWLEIYAYLDSTHQTFLGNTEALLFVNDKPYAGSGGCFSSVQSCTMSNNNKDFMACSIQLDPCELAVYKSGGLYMSIWIVDTSDYFWYQDTVGYTIETKLYNPNTEPFYLYDGYAVTGVVAEAEYVVYRIPPPLSGTISVTLSSTEENDRPLPAQIADSYCAERIAFGRENCTGTAGCGLCGTQCKPCSNYICTQLPFEGCTNVAKRQAIPNNNDQLKLHILAGENVIGPSCPCWRSLSNRTVSTGSVETFTENLSGCGTNSFADGAFIIVEGLVNANSTSAYRYRQNEYTLSVELEDIKTVYATIPLVVGKTRRQFGTLGATTRYTLIFERSDLLNHALVITTEAHSFSGAVTNLYAGYDDGAFQCNNAYPLGNCVINQNGVGKLETDGYCTITLQPCHAFSSDSDSKTFVVEVSGNPNIPDHQKQYSIYFELVPQTPKELGFGVALSDPSSAYRDLYNHYVVNVPLSAAGKQTLVVTAYFDAGHTYKDAKSITMSWNTPNRDRKAGDSDDCLCLEGQQTQDRKVVYIVNACKVQAGNYHFSIYTDQNIFDAQPQYYTIKAELLDNVVDIGYNVPMDYSVYRGQQVTFKFVVPDSMINSQTDVEKVISAKILTTRQEDAVTMHLTDDNPGDCTCKLVPLFNCPTPAGSNDTRPDCEQKIGYCGLTTGEWYVTVTGNEGRDPFNPIPFSLILNKINDHQDVTPIKLTSGCDDQVRGPNVIDHFVDTEQYRHYKVSGNQGSETVEVHLTNITDGILTVFYNTDNLATAQCNIANSTLSCSQTDVDSSCILPTTCATRFDYFSIYGQSTNKNKPVKYKVSICSTPLQSISLDKPVTGQKLTDGGVMNYKLSLSSLADQSPIAIVLTNTENAAATLTLSQAACSGCGAFSTTNPQCDGECAFIIFPCQLPLNYKNVDFVVRVSQGARGADFTYDLTVKTLNPGAPQTLKSNDETTIVVPPLSVRVATWTIAAGDVIKFDNGIQVARIDFKATDANGVGVQAIYGNLNDPNHICPGPNNTNSRFAQDVTTTYGVGSCCLTSGVYAVTLINNNIGTELAASFTLKPYLDTESANTKMRWGDATGKVVQQVSVPGYPEARSGATPVLPPIYQEYLLQYPGLDKFDSSLITRVEPTSDAFTNTKFYYSTGTVAGDRSPCYSTNSPVTGTFANYTTQLFECEGNQVLPDDTWFGFENTATDPSQFTITVVNQPSKSVPFNKATTFSYTEAYLREPTILLQYYVDVDSVQAPLRFVVVEVTDATETVNIYFLPEYPAGPNAQNCLSNILSGVAGPDGADFKANIPSCSVPDGRYYIGIAPSTKGDGPLKYTINVHLDYPNQDKLVNLPLAIAPASPTVLDAQTLDSDLGYTLYNLRTPDNLPEASYVKILLGRVGVQTALNYTIDGEDTCVGISTQYCPPEVATPDPTTDFCSTIIFPCDLRPSSNYTLSMYGPIPESDYSISAQLKTVTPIEIETNGVFVGSVDVHDLAIFKLPLSEASFSPGQNIQVVLSEVTCGRVEAWISRKFVAGPSPNCHIENQAPCTEAGCVLYGFDSCNLLSKDLTADWYVTVRGLYKFNVEPQLLINFKLEVTTTGNSLIKPIHTNEEHVLYAHRVDTSIDTCPPYQKVLFPDLCCPVPATPPQYAYQVEDVHWVYNMEGPHYIENHNQIVIELAPRVLSARIYLSAEAPNFCDNNYPSLSRSRYTYDCTADAGNACIIDLDKYLCDLVDARQIFIWIDPATVTPTIVGVGSEDVPVAYITNNKHFYTVVDVNYKETTQYVQLTLRHQEQQFFRVKHDQASKYNYWFRASVYRADHGLDMIESWDVCNDFAVCTEDDACSNANLDSCGIQNPCSCRIQNVYCSNNINQNMNSFFHVTPYITPVPPANVWSEIQTEAVIQFDFLHEVLPIPPDCQIVTGVKPVFYDPKIALTPEQVWRFTLSAYGAAVSINVGEDRIPVPYQPCSVAQTCNTNTLTGCDFYYRRDSATPYLSILGSVAGDNKYLITAQAVDVKPVTLNSGVIHTSPVTVLENTCEVNEFSNWFKFTPQQGTNYMLVELTSPSATVYLYPGHVAYAYSLNNARQCSTDGRGYCSFLVACDLNQTTYYFHIPSNSTHSIKVTSMTATPQPLALDASAAFTLTTPGQLQVYVITVENANSENPTKDLNLEYNLPAGVQSWVNRNIWGDDSCAVTLDLARPPFRRVLECAIHEKSEKYFVSFLNTIGDCTPASAYLKASLSPDPVDLVTNAPVNGNTANATANPGEVVRMHFDLQTVLGQDELFYVRLPKIQYGDVTHIVKKGNHQSPTAQRSIGCTENSCTASGHPHVSWHDVCFHCDIYSDIFVEVTGLETVAQRDETAFDVQVARTTWKTLSATSLSSTLPGPSNSLDFYTVPIPEASGHLLNIQVTNGVGLEVEVHPKNCALRGDSFSVWCFYGQECQIALPTRGNFGSFISRSDTINSLWDDTDLRIVIYGRDTQYTIQYFTGTEACSGIVAATSPFCAPVEQRPAWGTVTTFKAKDDHASTFYEELYTAFSCLRSSGCDCRTLSQPCIDNLKAYACETSMPRCNQNGGFAIPPSYSRCDAVQNECQATFEQAGLPHLSCYHNFYFDGRLFVTDPGQNKIFSADGLTPANNGGNSNNNNDHRANPSGSTDLTGLWIFLGLFFSFIIIGVVAYFLYKNKSGAASTPTPAGGKAANPYVIL